MAGTSKDLLQLEHNNSTSSSIESALLVCNKESHSQLKKSNPDEKPVFNPLPRSQVLGKVKDFLGVMSEANERLQLDSKEKTQDYDIEVLTGNESEVIEMLIFTPEAVMAAESAIAGNQPMIPLAASSSGTNSEGSSEDSDDSGDNDDEEDDEYSDNDDANGGKKTRVPMKVKRSKTIKDESEASEDKKSQKWPKIVELS